MGAVPKLEAWRVSQPEERFVDQAGGVERVLRRRASQPPVRQLAQLLVDERDELISGAFVPRVPPSQQTGDVGWGRRHTSLRHWGPPA
jgi:hypothetical protein